MERTGYTDINGEMIYYGQPVEFWDEEGGSGVGIVCKDKKYGPRIKDPSEDHFERMITTLESFKKSVQILKPPIKNKEIYDKGFRDGIRAMFTGRTEKRIRVCRGCACLESLVSFPDTKSKVCSRCASLGRK